MSSFSTMRLALSLINVSAALTLASALTLPRTATGAECQGVQFADTADLDGQSLMLNGLGIRKATFLKVKVYVAGLYVPQTSKSAEDLLSKVQARRLRLVFVPQITPLTGASLSPTGWWSRFGFCGQRLACH